ncbi:hypothetical protein V1281_000012 [Nitrobacteraceae bacterium AZCC 2161]|jgi:hypothetical protein
MAAASAASITSRWQISSGRSATYMNITLHVVSGDDDATVRGERDLLHKAAAILVVQWLELHARGCGLWSSPWCATKTKASFEYPTRDPHPGE